MNSASKDRPLTNRTILISPSRSGELANELALQGARILAWPKLDSGGLANYTILDESIENLFGYDWIIFRNVNAADSFLRRFHQLGRDISELDAVRVCAIGEATTNLLDEAQIHIDVNPDRLSSEAAFTAIEAYVGGHSSFAGLNFLMPRAAISRDSFTQAIEDAGARVDVVPAYRTSAADNAALAQIKALLTGGGVDCVVFTAPSEVLEFGAVFDTNDLPQLVDGSAVVCVDATTARAAAEFGLQVDVTPGASTILALVRGITAQVGSLAQ